MENPERSDVKHFSKYFLVSCSATADQGISNEVIEIIPLSESENSDSTMMAHAELVSKRSKSCSEQNDKKTLILFEDVDAVLEEDRGFIGTIQRLAETAKRPMILTSNSKIVPQIVFFIKNSNPTYHI